MAHTKRSYFFICLVVAFLQHAGAAAVTKATFIFDADGVLFTQDQRSVMWQVGPSYFVGWYNPFKIQKNYFEFLETIPLDSSYCVKSSYQGQVLPQLMCDWLSGVRSPESIRELVHTHISTRTSGHGHKQDKMFGAIADFMFTPERFTKTIIPVKKGVKLLKKCYMQRDEYGNRAHKLYLLTNWEAASFDLLYTNRKIRKVLDLFDGIIVSGEVKLLKPDPQMYEYAFKQFNIDLEYDFVIYIDDEEAHIRVARTLSRKLRCLHCKDLDIDSLHKDLRRLGVL